MVEAYHARFAHSITWQVIGFAQRGRLRDSIAATRIHGDVLPRRIAIIAATLRQIISGTLRCLRAHDRTGGSTHDRTGRCTGWSPRDETAQQSAHNGASYRACGRIRRWRGWWRRVGAGRRCIACCDRRLIGTGGIVDGLDVGHIGRRPIHLLRVKIPGSSHIPPPSVASVVDFVAPMPTLPGDAAVVGMSGEIVRGHAAAPDMRNLRPSPGRRPRAHRRRVHRTRPACTGPGPTCTGPGLTAWTAASRARPSQPACAVPRHAPRSQTRLAPIPAENISWNARKCSSQTPPILACRFSILRHDWADSGRLELPCLVTNL